MTKTFGLIALVAGLAVAPAAPAQEPDAPASTPEPAASAPAASAPAAPATAFTPEDIQKFARAVTEVAKIQGDATVAETDKQAKMAAAVQAQGLEPQKFNEIAQAAQTDPALQEQIRAASAPAQ